MTNILFGLTIFDYLPIIVIAIGLIYFYIDILPKMQELNNIKTNIIPMLQNIQNILKDIENKEQINNKELIDIIKNGLEDIRKDLEAKQSIDMISKILGSVINTRGDNR